LLLVVDDYQDTLEALVRILRLEGYEAVGKSSAQEAMSFLAANTPSLVVLDYNMGDTDGLTVFADMKKDPRLAKIPVIMFSATDDRVKEIALRAGVDAYVKKGSLDWGELHREIIRLVGVGKPPAQVEENRNTRAKDVG
jgi:CheY-like chemotaxis protein